MIVLRSGCVTAEIEEMGAEIKSLKLDAKESASLLLLATDAYRNKDYASAVSYWRRVLDSDNEALDRRAVIQSIAEAQAKLKAQQ